MSKIKTQCFAHDHMTAEEFAIWNFAAGVSHKSKIFRAGSRVIAAHFEGMSQRTANRRVQSLVAKGWFEKIGRAGRNSLGWVLPSKFKVLTHDEYETRYPQRCKECLERIRIAIAAIEAWSVQSSMTPEVSHESLEVFHESPQASLESPMAQKLNYPETKVKEMEGAKPVFDLSESTGNIRKSLGSKPSISSASLDFPTVMADEPLQKVKGINKADGWLWPDAIRTGELTLIVGQPGSGKGVLTMDIAARVTNGKPWPNCPNLLSPSSAIIMSNEDNVGDMLCPRLNAAGADMKKIAFPTEAVKVAELEALLLETEFEQGAVRMVVIDPAANYLKTDNDIACRAELKALRALAQKYNLAIVICTHFNKGRADTALDRITSRPLKEECFQIYFLIQEEDGEGRLLYPVKGGTKGKYEEVGMNFHIVPAPKTAVTSLTALGTAKPYPCVAWHCEGKFKFVEVEKDFGDGCPSVRLVPESEAANAAESV
ncbi:MAG: AAA family ATPase [Acidobacteriota bacterium]|nr:AAA family ATPase [Acidobacteriota bacterium]